MFETIAVVDGRMPLWERHMSRLGSACKRLGFEAPAAGSLRGEAERIAAANRRSILRLIVTRGSGGEGYRPPLQAAPTHRLQSRAWPDYPAGWWQSGIRARICETRLAVGSPVAGLKHLNRLEQVLARSEWRDPDIAEGIMLDSDGYVVEGTMTNIFIQEGARLLTPPLDRCGVAGVMRGLVTELVRAEGIGVSEQRLRLPRVLAADAVFFTNAVIGLWPLREAAGQRFPVTPVTRLIQQRLGTITGSRP